MSGKRHVIVTGGSRGLGLGIVEALLAEGYRVSTCSRAPSAALERLAGADLFWKPCRIGDGEEVRAFMDAALDCGGASPLWGLVNNAGIARDGGLATFPGIGVEAGVPVNRTGRVPGALASLAAPRGTAGPGAM
ncbi:SDR family NAD(P)-dependent oxidoreductase, partial [Azospirillum brasilense]|nr:SDR family NAD(P)-dependent oxidoreductase [Azospirillum brasilense]